MANFNINNNIIKRLLSWIIVMLCLVGIPTGLSFYAVYKYYSILENENLINYKIDRQHIAGIAEQATNQQNYLAQHFINRIRDLSKENLQYEDIVEWIKQEQQRLNYDFEFTTLKINSIGNYELGESSKNIGLDKKTQLNILKELIHRAPHFLNGELRTTFTQMHSLYKETKKVFGKQLFERSLRDLVNYKSPLIVWADSSKKKPPFATYIVHNCLMLLVFKPESMSGNSVLKLTLKELGEKYPYINMGIKDAQNLDEDLWWSNKSLNTKIDNELFDTFESDGTELYTRPDDYISYQYLSPRFRLVTIGKKKYNDLTITIYSIIGALIYLSLMSPFILYTKTTIINDLPGKASIRLKLIFLLWFATGIPLIAMSIISQEHYQNKRLSQLSNIQKLTKETITNYDKRYRSFTKNISIDLNKYFANWAKEVKENGYNAQKHMQTRREIADIAFTDTIYVVASGSVIGNYCGYIEYDGDIDNPKINYKRSTINRPISDRVFEEIRSINIITKKILSDLNHEQLEKNAIRKLEIFAESILQLNFAEITNEIMTKIKEIHLWGFFENSSQTYFDFIPVYNKNKYDYAVTCFWFSDNLQKIFLNKTLTEVNRNPTGVKILIYNQESSSFYPNELYFKDILNEYILQKENNEIEDNNEIEFIKIKDKPYAVVNCNKIKQKDAIKKYKLEAIDKKQISKRYTKENEYSIFPLPSDYINPKIFFKADLYPSIIKDEKNIIGEYVNGLGNTEAKEIEILTIDNKKYAVFSSAGQYLDIYKIISLYPLKNIEYEINEEKTDLIMYIVFSLILAISVAQLLVTSFIIPLNKLRAGAIAIEEKNYNHRIEDIGNDEFGEVSSIFNKIIVGLSEVETAKIVQESLFPKENFEQNNFKIYGRNVAMSGVGGDYYDYFASDQDNFSALVGDVAGHGIAAALIMAMAKSGVLCNKEQQNSPKTILALLHKLILKSKSENQRKIMTFQYMYCNSQTGEGLYANAGACSPFIYRKKTNVIEELKLLAPVLGGFKRSTYNEIPVSFEPGDAIIFYTDGIVESRNKKGVEIGYNGLKEIIQKSYSLDPAIFYNNIYNTYLKFIEGMDAQDDITIVVAIFQPHKPIETQENNDGKEII